MKRQRGIQYYSDGVTKITDPFYVCKCPAGHDYWGLVYERTCYICGRRLLGCLPAGESHEDKKRAATKT